MNRDVCEHFNPVDLPCDKCKSANVQKSTLREAAQQALEALQNCANGEDDVLLTRDALAALRAALAEPVILRTPEECIDILLQRMNISELAQAIGVDASAISHVKAGRMRITHYEKVDKLRGMV